MRRADLACGIVFLGAAVVVVVEGLWLGIGWSTDGPQPGFFVFYLGLVLAVSSLVILAQAARGADTRLYRRRFIERRQVGPVLKVLLPAVLMVLATHVVGLYVAGALYLGTYMRWIGRHPWPLTVLLGVGIPLGAFLVFEVWFLVPMPKGPLEAYLGY